MRLRIRSNTIPDIDVYEAERQKQQLLATLKAAKVIDSIAGIQYAKVLAKSMKKLNHSKCRYYINIL